MIINKISDITANFGPELIGKIAEELVTKFKVEEWKRKILTRYLSVSFYEGFRIVLKVKEDKDLSLDVDISKAFNNEERLYFLL